MAMETYYAVHFTTGEQSDEDDEEEAEPDVESVVLPAGSEEEAEEKFNGMANDDTEVVAIGRPSEA